MGTPFLLAMTPRAGSTNYRYVVSEGSGLDETRAVALIADALKLSDGKEAVPAPHFLAAVKYSVFQMHGGRTGEEVLLLGGIDARRLKDDTRQEMLSRLGQRLEDLQGVINRINWEVEPGLLVEAHDLSAWLRRDFRQAASAVGRRGWLLVGTATALAVLLVLGGARWFQARPSPPTTSSHQGKDKKKPAEKQLNDLYDQLLKCWGNLPEEQARKEFAVLLNLENPDRATLLKRPKMRKLLKKWGGNCGQLIDPFQLLEPEERGTLSALTEDRKLPVSDCVALRKCLADITKEFRAFRDVARSWELKSLNISDEQFPFLYMAKYMATADEISSLEQPVLPLFNSNDKTVLDKLQELMEKATNKGVWKKVPLKGNLIDQMKRIHKNHGVIKDALQDEFNRACGTTSPFKTKEQYRIAGLKGQMDLLIDKLSKIKTPQLTHTGETH